MADADDRTLEDGGAATIQSDGPGAGAARADAASAPRNDALARGVAVGRYVILERIGAGGMGVVYSAYDPQLDRRVAIKLLRAGVANDVTRQRLMREAQAMARVSHPNVLAVHDIGVFGDQVFIATEFVDGITLGEWQRKEARGWREVLALYLAAGRGLASAHSAGLVHRDFKPENVLIDALGRPRVLDFGLARELGESAPDIALNETQPGSADASPLSTPLTRAGAIVGTPAYMAPEQLRGAAVDARSDQFSFCASLYEALYRQRPFPGQTFASLMKHVTDGEVRGPGDAAVPQWLRAALLRGLSVRPADRFATLDALLAALTPEASGARAWLPSAVAVAVVLVGAGAFAMARHRSRGLCDGAGDKLGGVWDDARSRAVGAAFAASGAPFANDTAARVQAALDGYARDWAAMYTGNCQATRVRGEQSEELLDLRTQCLSARLEELRATTELFSRADAQMVANATKAVGLLRPVADCADVAALKAPVPPPSDPAARAQLGELRNVLASARALNGAGRFKEALPILENVLPRVEKLSYRPLAGEALQLLAGARWGAGLKRLAIATYEKAALAAIAGKDDLTAAEAYSTLVFDGYDVGELARAHQWADAGDAFLERLGNPPRVRARMLDHIASVLGDENKHDEEVRLYREAIRLAREGGDPNTVTMATHNLGVTLMNLDQPDESLALLRQAYVEWNERLGPVHPNTIMALENVALALAERGLYEEADDAMRRVLALNEQALGREHPDLWYDYNELARLACSRKRFRDALPLVEHAQKLFESQNSPNAYRRVFLGDTLGRTFLGLGQPERAIAPLEDALRVDTAAAPETSADVRARLADAITAARGDRARARKLLAEADALLAGRPRRDSSKLIAEVRARVDGR